MQTIILIAGFIGSWLLVAGPIFQAVLELHDENLERDRLQAIGAKVAQIPKVSAWWWLVPPVKLYLERQRSARFRRAYFDALTPEDSEAMISFMSKATGWFFVGTGGFLLAAKETYELSEYFHWPLYVYFLVVIVFLMASVANTVIRMRRSQAILESKQ